jgi:hypothetical protein
MSIRRKAKLREKQYEVLNEENTKFVVATWIFNAWKERNKWNWQRNKIMNHENGSRKK